MSTGRTAPRGVGATATSQEQESTRLDLGRRRAKRAWDWVVEAKSQGEKYVKLTQKLPSILQVSGLGQTFAYLYSKGYERGRPSGKPEGLLLRQLSDYVRETEKQATTGGDPMEELLNLSAAQYRSASREIMAVAEWLKRFADGKLADAANRDPK